MNLLSHPQLQEVVLNNLAIANVLGMRSASSATNAVVLQLAQGKLADATRDVPNDAMEARRRINTSPRPCCPFSFVRLLQRALPSDKWSDVTAEVHLIDERLFSGVDAHRERELVECLLGHPKNVEFLYTKLPAIGSLGPLLSQCCQLRFLATPTMDYAKFSDAVPEPCFHLGKDYVNREPPSPPPTGFETAASVLSKLPNIELFGCKFGNCDTSELFTTAASSWPKLVALEIDCLDAVQPMVPAAVEVLRRIEVLEIHTCRGRKDAVPLDSLLHSCRSLRVLRLQYLEDTGLIDIFSRNPQLEEIAFSGFGAQSGDSFLPSLSHLRNLSVLSINLKKEWNLNTWQAALGQLAPQLVHLNISGNHDHPLSDGILTPLAAEQHRLALEVFIIYGSRASEFTDSMLARILSSSPRLQSFCCNLKGPGKKCAVAAARHCPSLRVWSSLSGEEDDDDIAMIAKGCMEVESLSTSAAISDATLTTLLRNARNLRSLEANGSELTADGIKALGALGSGKITRCILERVAGYEDRQNYGSLLRRFYTKEKTVQEDIDIDSCLSPGDVLKFLHRTQPQMRIPSPPMRIVTSLREL